MHANEVDTSPELVHRLLLDQFPNLAGPEPTLVDSYGTDHDIYRVGDGISVRMPRVEKAAAQAFKEGEWLPKLGPRLPLAVPLQLGIGQPGADFPFTWSVYEWLDGANANGTITDHEQAAVDLAGFIGALRSISTDGAHTRPKRARGAPLAENDGFVRYSIDQLTAKYPDETIAAITDLWAQSLAAPVWTGSEMWLHGDLLPGNLIVVDGNLSAVIDWGSLHVGDPACDLQPAWNVFEGASRDRFRSELGADDASWLRGRGWALYQAVGGLFYYWDTNPGMIRQTTNALNQILVEAGHSPSSCERKRSESKGGWHVFRRFPATQTVRGPPKVPGTFF